MESLSAKVAEKEQSHFDSLISRLDEQINRLSYLKNGMENKVDRIHPFLTPTAKMLKEEDPVSNNIVGKFSERIYKLSYIINDLEEVHDHLNKIV